MRPMTNKDKRKVDEVLKFKSNQKYKVIIKIKDEGRRGKYN